MIDTIMREGRYLVQVKRNSELRGGDSIVRFSLCSESLIVETF